MSQDQPTPHLAVLIGREVVPVRDVMEWGRAFESGRHIIAQTTVADALVSTVFMGINTRYDLHDDWRDGLWFETMLFPDATAMLEDDCWRCSTYDQAEAQHRAAVQEAILRFGATADQVVEVNLED